jgi:excisionase family DNA binding protein
MTLSVENAKISSWPAFALFATFGVIKWGFVQQQGFRETERLSPPPPKGGGLATTRIGDSIVAEPKYNLPRVMTVRELSAYLRVHPSTIYKLLRRGELPGFRIGTDWRFNAEVIDRWCLERNMKPADEVAMRGNW